MVDITGVIDCTIDDPSCNNDRARLFMSRCVFVKQKHTAWLVIQRMNRSTGGQFLAPSMFEIEALARAYAAMFSDVVSVQKIEWED